MRDTHCSGGSRIAVTEWEIGDAAIGVYEEQRANYRQRAEAWKRICELRAADHVSQAMHAVGWVLLHEFWNAKTGVCFPTKKTIQEKVQAVYDTTISLSTVKRALKRFRHFGVFDWITQRFPQVVIEAGRAVWKCVQGPNLYHLTPEKFRVEAWKIARKALHLAKKKAALAAATAKREAVRAVLEQAKRIRTVLSGGQVRTGEPAASVSTKSMWKTGTREDWISARMNLAQQRRAERLRREESSCDDAVLASARGSGFQ